MAQPTASQVVPLAAWHDNRQNAPHLDCGLVARPRVKHVRFNIPDVEPTTRLPAIPRYVKWKEVPYEDKFIKEWETSRKAALEAAATKAA